MLKKIMQWFKKARPARMNAQPGPPPGMIMDSRGHFAPVDSISPQALAVDQRVREIAALHVDLSMHLERVRKRCAELAIETLSILNVTKESAYLYSYDESIRVEIDTYKHKQFNSQLAAAHGLMMQAITRWSKHSTGNGHPQLIALAEQRIDFERMTVNEKQRLMDLLKVEAPNDPDWVAAQAALQRCFDILWTKKRVRVYQRTDEGKYKLVVVNYSDHGRNRVGNGKPKSYNEIGGKKAKKSNDSMGLFH